MFSKRYHKYIILALVVALLFVLSCPAASADDTMAYTDRQRVAAMIGAALSALNITLESLAMPVTDVYNYLSDPLDVVYTYQDDLLSDYYDKSTIQVWDNYTEIDGVRYTDIWFGNKPADMFRINAGDLETAWNITSNSTGTAVSGAGFFDGAPLYTLPNNLVQSQKYTFSGAGSYALGSGSVNIAHDAYNPPRWYASWSASSAGESRFAQAESVSGYYQLTRNSNTSTLRISSSDGSTVLTGPNDGHLVDQPFTFDWVSGTIPADPIPDSDTGLMIRVPASDVQDWVQDHPEYTAPGGVNVDLDVDPSVSVDIDDLVDKLIPLIPIIPVGDINFAPQHTDSPDPDPDPQPVPDIPDSTLLPQTPWGNLRDRLDRIIETIQNIPTPSFPSLQPIIDSITSLGDKILQDIQRGPIDIFDKGIDVLRDLFAPFFSGLSSALGIWHYVVDWLGSISAPFYWILGIASGTSGIILGPVYAMVAGCIVIAIYRRFGR